MSETTKQSHSEEQAESWLDSIREMVAALKATTDGVSLAARNARDDAECQIQQSALSLEVRSGWYTLAHDSDRAPAEYCLLLCTGGPAVRIIGDLDEHAQPETARIEHQDWGTPWTEYRITDKDEQTLLDYARTFYFGD